MPIITMCLATFHIYVSFPYSIGLMMMNQPVQQQCLSYIIGSAWWHRAWNWTIGQAILIHLEVILSCNVMLNSLAIVCVVWSCRFYGSVKNIYFGLFYGEGNVVGPNASYFVWIYVRGVLFQLLFCNTLVPTIFV